MTVMVRLTHKGRTGSTIHTPGSNFWVGISGRSAEHEFQSRKTRVLREKLAILTAKTPAEAKRLGRKCSIRPEWETVKQVEMKDVLLRKALSEPEFVDWLLETGDAEIIEFNWWHDNFWGICTCDSCKQHYGHNTLGKLLMELRELVRSYDPAP